MKVEEKTVSGNKLGAYVFVLDATLTERGLWKFFGPAARDDQMVRLIVGRHCSDEIRAATAQVAAVAWFVVAPSQAGPGTRPRFLWMPMLSFEELSDVHQAALEAYMACSRPAAEAGAVRASGGNGVLWSACIAVGGDAFVERLRAAQNAGKPEVWRMQ